MSGAPSASPTTATADFVVNGKTYQTWYTIFGDLKSLDHTPLVCLHGGPGLSHDYMLPNSKLFSDFKIPVVLYDQLGCGKSSHITDVPASFWSAELYKDELENLLHHLGISGNFDLLGQSWGGMLASDFAASRRPPGLRRLIIANSPCSMKLAYEGIHLHMRTFPPGSIETLRQHEENGTMDSPEYIALKTSFVKKHICTVDPWPAELLASFAEHAKDPTVDNAMLGGYLLKITGNLKDWDVAPILHQINRPTLLLHSPTDEVHETAFMPFFENIQKVKWVEFHESSHLAHFEEPARSVRVRWDYLWSCTNSIPIGTDILRL